MFFWLKINYRENHLCIAEYLGLNLNLNKLKLCLKILAAFLLKENIFWFKLCID